MIHVAFTCSLSLSPPPTSYNGPALWQPCYNLVQMFLCPLFSLLYLVSSVFTWSHSRGRQYNGACHLVHPPALLLFNVMVRAVLWPWTLPRSTNHLLFNCISRLPTHWIVLVWIRVLGSLGLVHWKSLRRLGARHSNCYIISSYSLFILISYLNRYGSGHRSLNKKRYF